MKIKLNDKWRIESATHGGFDLIESIEGFNKKDEPVIRQQIFFFATLKQCVKRLTEEECKIDLSDVESLIEHLNKVQDSILNAVTLVSK